MTKEKSFFYIHTVLLWFVSMLRSPDIFSRYLLQWSSLWVRIAHAGILVEGTKGDFSDEIHVDLETAGNPLFMKVQKCQ